MSIALWIIIVIWVLAILWFIFEAITAPEGYEDEDGFHKGRKQ